VRDASRRAPPSAARRWATDGDQRAAISRSASSGGPVARATAIAACESSRCRSTPCATRGSRARCPGGRLTPRAHARQQPALRERRQHGDAHALAALPPRAAAAAPSLRYAERPGSMMFAARRPAGFRRTRGRGARTVEPSCCSRGDCWLKAMCVDAQYRLLLRAGSRVADGAEPLGQECSGRGHAGKISDKMDKNISIHMR